MTTKKYGFEGSRLEQAKLELAAAEAEAEKANQTVPDILEEILLLKRGLDDMRAELGGPHPLIGSDASARLDPRMGCVTDREGRLWATVHTTPMTSNKWTISQRAHEACKSANCSGYVFTRSDVLPDTPEPLEVQIVGWLTADELESKAILEGEDEHLAVFGSNLCDINLLPGLMLG